MDASPEGALPQIATGGLRWLVIPLRRAGGMIERHFALMDGPVLK